VPPPVSGAELPDPGPPADATDKFVAENYQEGESAGSDQGMETGQGDIGQQASDFEQTVLGENPNLDAEDVRVDYNRETNKFEADLTDSGEQVVREQQQQRDEQARQEAEEAGFIEGSSGTTFETEQQQRDEQARQEAEEAGFVGGSSGITTESTDATDQFVDQNYRAGTLSRDAPEGAESLQSQRGPGGQTAAGQFGQGMETGRGEVAQQASDFEEAVLENNPDLDAKDVRVDYKRETNKFEADLTESGEQAVREQQQQRDEQARQEAEEAGLVEGSSGITTDERSTTGVGTAQDAESGGGEQTNKEIYSSAFDVLAGSTDETVGRAVDSAGEGDFAGAADALAGDTDEAVGRAVSAAQDGDAAGVGDALAGGTDEATGRFASSVGSFGSVETGDTLDEITNERTDTSGPFGEAVPSRVDESFARINRAFTDTDTATEFGGVVFDEALGTADEAFAGGFEQDTADEVTQDDDTGFLTEDQEADLNAASQH